MNECINSVYNRKLGNGYARQRNQFYLHQLSINIITMYNRYLIDLVTCPNFLLKNIMLINAALSISAQLLGKQSNKNHKNY